MYNNVYYVDGKVIGSSVVFYYDFFQMIKELKMYTVQVCNSKYINELLNSVVLM